MKQILSFFIGTVMLFLCTACGTDSDSSSEVSSAYDAVSDLEESEKENDTDISEDKNEENSEGKILVAYFSATGNTEIAAKSIAEIQNADIFEITAAEPYTEDDLNYNDDNCRANREQNDKSVRPEIAESIENMEEYDVVFIGYPIWLAYHKLIQCTQIA